MTKKTKVIVGVVAIVLVASIVAFSATKKGNKATEVRVEKVEKRDLTASVTASGQVRPQTKVDVSSDITGKIIALYVREGQALANMNNSQRSYERSADIKKKNPELVSDEQLDQLRTGAEVAKAVYEASTHQVGHRDGSAGVPGVGHGLLRTDARHVRGGILDR